MSSTRARGAVLVRPGQIELREFDLPDVSDDDALLQVEACGICGTDYEQYRGDVPQSDYRTPYPAIPGHEPLGTIASIGETAKERWGVKEGDRVAVRPFYGCGNCDACRQWQPRECRSRGGTYGFIDVNKPPGLWGGYADYLYLSPLSVVKKVDPTLPAEVAAMYNPLASGLSWGATIPKTGPDDRVVILGSGQRGLCCLIAAKAAGARQVVVTGLERDGYKLDLAKELGADATVVADRDNVVDSVKELTGGGAEVIVDTTPFAAESFRDALNIAVRYARLILVGLKGSRSVSDIYPDEIINKELVIRGVLATPFEAFEDAIELLESRRFPMERLHTHSFDVPDSATAIRTLAGDIPDAQAIHVAIVPKRGASNG